MRGYAGEELAWSSQATPMGVVWVAAQPAGVCRVCLPGTGQPALGPSGAQAHEASRILQWALRELREWLEGERRFFSVPLALQGTPFQLRVWKEIQAIPPGTTRSYGEIARGVASASRAVGQACGANPVPLLIPCHRVVRKDGSIGGFSGDITIKERLLAMEARLYGAGEGPPSRGFRNGWGASYTH